MSMGILSYISPQYYPKLPEVRKKENPEEGTAESMHKLKPEARRQVPPADISRGETFSIYV